MTAAQPRPICTPEHNPPNCRTLHARPNMPLSRYCICAMPSSDARLLQRTGLVGPRIGRHAVAPAPGQRAPSAGAALPLPLLLPLGCPCLTRTSAAPPPHVRRQHPPEQPVVDALGLVRPLPQHVAQQQAVVLCQAAPPAGVGCHLRQGGKRREGGCLRWGHREGGTSEQAAKAGVNRCAENDSWPAFGAPPTCIRATALTRRRSDTYTGGSHLSCKQAGRRGGRGIGGAVLQAPAPVLQAQASRQRRVFGWAVASAAGLRLLVLELVGPRHVRPSSCLLFPVHAQAPRGAASPGAPAGSCAGLLSAAAPRGGPPPHPAPAPSCSESRHLPQVKD